MEINCIPIQSGNEMVRDYINGRENTAFYHYDFRKKEAFIHRLEDIQNREYPRKELANHILTYMSRFPLTENTYRSIEKLKREDSVVVISGQQAGLLTGPLYTIHKIISTIQLAIEKEKELGVPVVPIFWIAGEDHDLHEVNHVYVLENEKVMKKSFRPTIFTEKKMVSKINLEQEKLIEWVESVFESYGETKYTNNVLQLLKNKINESETFTDFFAHIIHYFFEKYGLLMIDSAHPQLRQIEEPYFAEIFEKSITITEKLLLRQKALSSKGYPTTIESDPSSIQLFYEHLDERVLLHYDAKNDMYIGKGVSFTKEEILKEIHTHPDKFSNNVVTRPIMQEMLFPTLAFIAGPGEMSYWAELKDAFELFGMKIPPVVPRINITLLERNIESLMNEIGLSVEETLIEGTMKKKSEFFQSLKSEELDMFIENKRKEMIDIYQSIVEEVNSFDRGLNGVVQKNLEFVTSQIDYLKKKVEDSIKLKNKVALQRFDRIQHSIKPLNSWQERVWNVFYYINKYGESIIHDLMMIPFEYNGHHYVVKL